MSEPVETVGLVALLLSAIFLLREQAAYAEAKWWSKRFDEMERIALAAIEKLPDDESGE